MIKSLCKFAGGMAILVAGLQASDRIIARKSVKMLSWLCLDELVPFMTRVLGCDILGRRAGLKHLSRLLIPEDAGDICTL